jgi:electron transport complex protein RnfG
MVRLGMICSLAAVFFLGAAWAEELPLKEVFGEAASFVPVKKDQEIVYYEARDRSGKAIGAVFKAQGKSYHSDIITLAGMKNDGSITEIKVLAPDETPGVGSSITEGDFTGRFRNVKDLSGVQAITGATVSSRAVIDSVKERAEEIRKLIGGAP